VSKIAETVSLTTEEEQALSRLVGARLREIETSICHGFDTGEDFTKSDASDFCLVRAQDNDSEFFLTVQNSLRDIRRYWDVPKPEVQILNARPIRPATMRIGLQMSGDPMNEVV
jgi:hypothetical protein